ncbi:MAG: hypothetical protein Q7K57_43295 [Burkholderiaceae bacterium]|nr:hypothetical protein [Burkholderiaceae bacterium]
MAIKQQFTSVGDAIENTTIMRQAVAFAETRIATNVAVHRKFDEHPKRGTT